MVTWTERHGCYSARAGRFALYVSWSLDRATPGYVVSFEGAVLKKHFKNLEEAQAAAVRLAKKVLTKALKEVESEPSF